MINRIIIKKINLSYDGVIQILKVYHMILRETIQNMP